MRKDNFRISIFMLQFFCLFKIRKATSIEVAFLFLAPKQYKYTIDFLSHFAELYTDELSPIGIEQ